MARKISEIKKEMTDAFMADDTLQLKYGFDRTKTFGEQFSSVSLESILFSIIAASVWVLECLFDKHQEEVSETISKRAHTLAWYREKAMAFQYGCNLRADICEYDNSNLTEEEVEASKIVKKCSCENVANIYPRIQVKAVTSAGAMTTTQLTAFTSYIKEIADAGVQIDVVSKDPDKLSLGMTVMYDPLIIDANGTLLADNTYNIIETYIAEFLSNLEYNGEFYPNMLESYLMTCNGIKVANVTSIHKKADGEEVRDYTGLIKISPISGAFELDGNIFSDDTITYTAFYE